MENLYIFTFLYANFYLGNRKYSIIATTQEKAEEVLKNNTSYNKYRKNEDTELQGIIKRKIEENMII